ncbi:MAG: helix-hairpin-helix domain-containing protein [Flavobacteriaceae bacterium]|nr:helix-hairpin-helix domain-containing protein [Flavobacteriaceae bacterium]
MKIKEVKSQLVFHRSQRVGILFLLTLILSLLYVQFFVSFSEESTFNICSAEVLMLQQQLDSLRRIDSIKKVPKVYPFNPNYLTDYKAYTLGISPQAFDRLQAFRNKDQWVNSVAQFKEVTGVSDSLLAQISPYFKFPDWVTRAKFKKRYSGQKRILSFSEKIDLNKATEKELQQVYGIGQVLSQRIIKQRKRLGGFHHELELHTVWGLNDSVVARILKRFAVKTPIPINKLNINRCSASDLSTLPGVSFEMGKNIWEFVRVRDGLTDLSELLKIDEISPRRLQVFRLYLYAE